MFCLRMVLLAAAAPCFAANAGTHAKFAVLSSDPERAAPFAAVDVTYGPTERVRGEPHQWFQLDVHGSIDRSTPPLCILRILATGDPLHWSAPELRYARYLLRLPTSNETIEYQDARSDGALLPPWKDFRRHFIPQPALAAGRQADVPQTVTYLGHTLSLESVEQRPPEWPAWGDVKLLKLDRELLVGTGRNFRDAELKRLPQPPDAPQRQNYTYVRFTRDEYDTMIDAGINLFTVDPEQYTWIRGKPVFFHRAWEASAGTKQPDGTTLGTGPALQYPADLYRSNYLGPVMFMDEPAILMIRDRNADRIRTFADATTLLRQRVHNQYNSAGSYGAFNLDQALRKSGVVPGDMRIEQHDFPIWETMEPSSQYQLAAGAIGIVHEGRYRLPQFDRQIAKWTDPAKPRKHTPEEMLRYHYAHLRGAARATGPGKYWGTAIYGQLDPQISPQAMTLAYDMGARYLWFWTSDHGHHVPWPEQLELAKHLKQHAARSARPSVYAPPRQLDTAIVIPDGWWLELGDLWWVRAVDKEMKNDYARSYVRLMRRAHAAIHAAMDAKEDFDFIIDMGQPLPAYKKLVRIPPDP